MRGSYHYRVVPVLFRWLLPLIAVFALLAQPLSAIASAGLQGDPSCCCPEQSTCTCHDHKDASHDHEKMRRCGDTSAHLLVAPLLMAALPPPSRPQLLAPARATVPTPLPVAIPGQPFFELETPPF